MASITFHDAFIRHTDHRRTEEGAIFCRVHLTSNLTKPVMKAMEWDEVPYCLDSGKLGGCLTARSLVLTPNKKEFAKKELSLECSEISDFQVFHISGQDGASKRTELRFVARCNEEAAIARIDEYWRTIGTSGAQLSVTYNKQASLLEEQEGEKAAAAKA